jgi:hypothetical protein
MLAKGLIVAMLHPDPERRISVSESMRHPLCAAHFLGQVEPGPITLGTATPGIAFSLIPVAVAASTTASILTQSAFSLPNQQYMADAIVMPIASAIAAVTAAPLSTMAVALGSANIADHSESQEEKDKYSISMEVVNDEGYIPEGTHLRTDLEGPSPRSMMDHHHDKRHEEPDMYPSPCREQDDCDDGMFLMEEEEQSESGKNRNSARFEPPLDQNDDSNKINGLRNVGFTSLSGGSGSSSGPGLGPVDWQRQREGSSMAFPPAGKKLFTSL